MDDVFIAKAFGYMGQLSHQFAATGAAANVHVHATEHIAPRFALGTQIVQANDTRGRPRAPRLYAFAYPHFFLGQQLVGAGIDHRLLGQLLFFLQQIGGKITRVGQQLAPVQLDDARGHVVQK